MHRLVGLCLISMLIACSPEQQPDEISADIEVDQTSDGKITEPEGSTHEPEMPLEITRYFAAYKANDADALVETLSEDIRSYFYPSVLIAEGKDVLAPMIRDDISTRPDAYAEVVAHYRTGQSQIVVFANSINGEQRAPVLFVFGLDPETGKINRQHSLIMSPFFIRGPAMTEPTEGVRNQLSGLLESLQNADIAGAANTMAPDVSAFQWPPAGDTYGPLISGSSDVASVLQFKWGEGAWGGEAKEPAIWHVMHFAVVAIPSKSGGFDRVLLVTFDPDPASETYEKIIKADLTGPSGG